MITFSANREDLKRVFSVASLAADPSPTNPIDGHALIRVWQGKMSLYTTNKDLMASGTISIREDSEQNAEFTVDPRKISSLISSSDRNEIVFTFNKETMTVAVYAAEDAESYLSFPSLDSEMFLSFTSEFEKAVEIKKMDSQLFLYGIKFIFGFLPSDNRDKKFQNPYIDGDMLYGSDGITRLGAFCSDEFKGIEYLVLRKSVIPQMASMIENSETPQIVLKSTSRIILVSSADGVFNFGFLRASKDAEPPQFKIDLNKATNGGFNIDKELLLNRLKRLSIAADGAMGVELTVEEDKLRMRALSERDSVEIMPCKIVQAPSEKMQFIAEYRSLRNILKLFKASNVDIFVDSKGNRYQVKSSGNLVIGDKDPVTLPFVSVGIITMSRISKK